MLHLFKLGSTVCFMAESTPSTMTSDDGPDDLEGSDLVDLDEIRNSGGGKLDFSATEEVHKEETRKNTRGGRPRVEDPAIGVPNPKFRQFKSDATNQHQRTKSFINYWNALPQWAKDNTLLYVYREHPVLVYMERDPENKNPEYNYIDKISGSEPLQDELDLLNRYGCGNYKLIFNAIVTGKPNRTLCTVYCINIGGNDYKSNPPTDMRISDSKNVDLVHPSNAAYVGYLRGIGLLPSQIDAIRGENEMASVELLKESQTTQNKLVDTVVQMARENKATKSEDSGLTEKAVSGALGVLADAAKRSNEMVQESFKQATDNIRSNQQAPAPVPAGDPMALALQIVGLIQGGKDKDDPEVAELRRQVDRMREDNEKLRNDQVVALREEIKSMRDRPTEHSGNPFHSIEAGMKAMKQMKEVVDEISGGGDKGSVVEDAADMAGAPKWLVRFAPLMQQGLSLVDGFIRMRSGQQMPPPGGYPPNPGYPPPQQWNGPGPVYQPNQAPGQPAMVNGPQLVQQPARHPLGNLDITQFTPELTQLLSAIAIPLGVHIASGDTGGDFADWFVGGFGDDTHQGIQGFGVDGVMGALYSFPATLTQIHGFDPAKVRVFVEEFLTTPQQGEGEGDQAPDPAQPA